MRREIIKQKGLFTYRNLCWLTLFAVVFQVFYVSSASALPLQISAIYANCNHCPQSHGKQNSLHCIQCCELTSGKHAQNVLLDVHSPASIAKISDVSIYFNQQLGVVFAISTSVEHSFENQLISSKVSHVYFNTSRLRI